MFSGSVVHRRREPVRHEFRYRVSFLCFDVDDTAALARKAPWLGIDRSAAVSWWRRDHGSDADSPLGDSVRDLVHARCGRRQHGPVWLLTTPRVLGYGFNPISFFFCGNDEGAVEAIVAEVTSTPWKERHSYVLPIPRAERSRGVHRFVTPKRLHVSPFLGMEQTYRWRIASAGNRFSAGIVAESGKARPFAAALSLAREPLQRASLARFLFQPPVGAAGTMAAIHYEALRLWWKGVPYHLHPRYGGIRRSTARGGSDGDRACPE